MTRLEQFAARVTREMLDAYWRDVNMGSRGDGAFEAARAVLEREVRAFVTELCGNRDAFLDAPADPEPGKR